ncbi:hypothetical protein ABBQ38_003098 [Trebouxia sp. C0009 RCD-2024]
MAANPALSIVSHAGQTTQLPALYAQEVIALQRDGIDFSINGLRHQSGKWSTRGVLYLTNLRLVFVAKQADAASGLVAFELPLAYVRKDKFNQPIFACNNLSGECWPAAPGGGPQGNLPPHGFSLYFKEGGVGTFLPLYFSFVGIARDNLHKVQQQPSAPQELVATAFVDPSDPSRLYLAQPSEPAASERPSAPKYAANYGVDEPYEAM